MAIAPISNPRLAFLCVLSVLCGESCNFRSGTARTVASSGRQNNSLARTLLVEQLIGFFRLFQLPAMREQLVDVDAAIGDISGAVRLADGRESPRTHQRDLPAQQVAADVERDAVAFAHEARFSPGANAAHRLGSRLRRGRRVER